MNSFGQLWDQLKSVEVYLEHGASHMTLLNDYMKALSNAEMEYSYALTRLSKPFHDILLKANEKALKVTDPLAAITVSKNSTVVQAWEKLLVGTEAMATLHSDLASTLTVERKNVKANIKIIDIHNKANWDKLRLANIELGKLMEGMDRNHATYNREMNSVDLVNNSVRKFTKEKKDKELDRTKIQLEKQLVDAKEASFQYRKSIDDCNVYKNSYYTKILPDILVVTPELKIGYSETR